VSAFASFEAGAAVVEVAVAGGVAVVEATAAVDTWDCVPPAVVAPGAGAANSAGARLADACPPGDEAQPPTMLVSRMMAVVPEVRMRDICSSSFRWIKRYQIVALLRP
jgi:hypothetical protein